MKQLRMLSYNVHKGFCASNRRFLLDEIREGIRSVNADLVFLQEVVGENRSHASRLPNWVDAGHFEYLADSVWPHYAYGRNAIYDHGHHGNAILSKYPIEHSDNVDVSVIKRSQRGLLFAKITPGVQLVCAHMGLLAWERRRQFQQLGQQLEQRLSGNQPLIIAGDFNDWRMRLHQRFSRGLGLREALTERYGKPARTFPARRPLLPLDRIYFRGLTLRDARILHGEPWQSLSDHCALYAEFELP
ncbi:endonuclease/exonuclease/phosphatase family protein [Spongiibacter sp.]|uniref:endonuclease/exonuclease/phosphatase family protein n=1 Tax=Spongiibacter sp. TaxID=2024860 RepID=UPI003563B1E5